MQEKPSEIAVVQISGTEYIMKCYHNMVDQIPQHIATQMSYDSIYIAVIYCL